jgi:hypothetical protein
LPHEKSIVSFALNDPARDGTHRIQLLHSGKYAC